MTLANEMTHLVKFICNIRVDKNTTFTLIEYYISVNQISSGDFKIVYVEKNIYIPKYSFIS